MAEILGKLIVLAESRDTGPIGLMELHADFMSFTPDNQKKILENWIYGLTALASSLEEESSTAPEPDNIIDLEVERLLRQPGNNIIDPWEDA